MLGGRAGVSCRLSRISGIQEASITPLQGKERRTSRKFFPGTVFCEGPDVVMQRGSHSPNRICVTWQISPLSLHAGILENGQFAYLFGELKIVVLTEDSIKSSGHTKMDTIVFIPVISIRNRL